MVLVITKFRNKHSFQYCVSVWITESEDVLMILPELLEKLGHLRELVIVGTIISKKFLDLLPGILSVDCLELDSF